MVFYVTIYQVVLRFFRTVFVFLPVKMNSKEICKETSQADRQTDKQTLCLLSLVNVAVPRE